MEHPVASHRPQHGPRPSDEYFRRFHADLVKHNPWNFERAGFYPYGVWVCDDGSQVMFDRSYRPMWSRPGERTIATRADPAQWIEWVGMYFFHDDRPAPRAFQGDARMSDPRHAAIHWRWAIDSPPLEERAA